MYNLFMKFPFLLTTLILSLNVFSDEVNDPFEDFNRKTFEFNEKLDEKIAKPVAEKYAKLLGYNYQSSLWYEQSYKIFNTDYRTSFEIKKEKNSVFSKFKKLFK